MRTPVICKNCGIKWIRVVPIGDLEMNIDLQAYCPKCGSNWCEPINEEAKGQEDAKTT